jgi:hypothetical protein
MNLWRGVGFVGMVRMGLGFQRFNSRWMMNDRDRSA